MAITKVATDFNILSDLVKHEYAPQWGYCRGNVTVAAAKVMGDLVQADGAIAASESAIVGVVLKDVAAGGSALILKRGAAGVLKSSINYGALTPATVDAKLESLGIQVIKSAE